MIASGLGGSRESHAAPCFEGRRGANRRAPTTTGVYMKTNRYIRTRSRGALADNIVSPRLTRKG
jgi:hypothetical protein